MEECENLKTCAFFKIYQDDPERQLALKGMIRLFCNGDKQTTCKRKMVSQVFGKNLVPKNLMPNGYALSGTTMDSWDPKVIVCLNDIRCGKAKKYKLPTPLV